MSPLTALRSPSSNEHFPSCRSQGTWETFESASESASWLRNHLQVGSRRPAAWSVALSEPPECRPGCVDLAATQFAPALSLYAARAGPKSCATNTASKGFVHGRVGTSKRIAPAGYLALADALAVIYWNKRPFESFLRNALRDYPELLVKLDFGLYKRETTAQLVDLLAADERRYQELTLGLMLEVSAMESFPNLRSQTDAKELTARAVEAVAELREWTKKLQQLVTERAKVEEDRAKEATKAANRRLLAEKLDQLKTKFYELHAATNPQQRGRDFESWLNELFMIFDLLPRRGFVLAR